MDKFSIKHNNIDDWLQENVPDTPYKRRILRLHHLYPEASLAQLRGHPGKGEQSLYWTKLKQAYLKVPCQFRRIAERYAETAGCSELDRNSRRIIWRRPRDEPK